MHIFSKYNLPSCISCIPESRILVRRSAMAFVITIIIITTTTTTIIIIIIIITIVSSSSSSKYVSMCIVLTECGDRPRLADWPHAEQIGAAMAEQQ